MKLTLWFPFAVGYAHQVIEDVRLTLPARRLHSALAQGNGELAGQDSGDQEDKQGNPFFHTVDGKDIQRRHEEVIEGEKGHQRGKNCRVAATCARQGEYHEQIHDGDVGNARVELEQVNDSCDQHRSSKCQYGIKQIALPWKHAVRLDGQHVFNGTHTGTTFPLRQNHDDFSQNTSDNGTPT